MRYLLALLLIFQQCCTIPQHTGATATSGGGGITVICSQTTGNFYTTANCTTNATALSGTRLVLPLFGNAACNDASFGISSITDQVGNTYAIDTTATGEDVCLYSSQLGTTLPSGDTITLHCATSGNCNWAWYAYNLTPSNGTVEQANATANLSGCGTCTITAAGAVTHTDWCVAVGGSLQGTTVTSESVWNNSFTTNHNFVVYTSNIVGVDGYKQVGSGTPTTSTTVSPTGNNFYGAIACYEQ